MKEYVKTSIVLALVCAAAAITLAFLNGVTKPIILEYEAQKTLDALEAVSVGLTISEDQILVEDNSVINYYFTLSEEGIVKGYLLNLNAGGYGGLMTIVASYDKDGQVLQAKVVSDSETPGLGKKVEEDWYMTKYIETTPVPTRKSELDNDEAAAISGATITFVAVGNALLTGSNFVKKMGGN